MNTPSRRAYFDFMNQPIPDPWAMFSLEPGADLDTITAKYRQLILEFPPETNPQMFEKIAMAYRRLIDPTEVIVRECRFVTFIDAKKYALIAQTPTTGETDAPSTARSPEKLPPSAPNVEAFFAGELFLYACLYMFSQTSPDPESPPR